MHSNLDTLFLDRDGVINYKINEGYVRSKEEFVFIPDFLKSIGDLTLLFRHIIIITNQQGIGKGLMTAKDLYDIHDFMVEKIKDNNGSIDKIYYCPHLESDNCFCRKPKSGMIVNALEDFPDIDVRKSYLIGDSTSDILAGKKEKLNVVKVTSSYTIFDWYKTL